MAECCAKGCGRVSWLVGAVFLALAGPVAASTTIVTVGGEEYHGEVLTSNLNTLTIKQDETGYQIVPLREIDRVRLEIEGAEPVEGRFLDWRNGRWTIRVGDRLLSVESGRITSDTSLTTVRPTVAEQVPDDVEPAVPPAGGPNLPDPSLPTRSLQPVAPAAPALPAQPAPPAAAPGEPGRNNNVTM